jgi:F0F1-type ATP synthase epsilon subunit
MLIEPLHFVVRTPTETLLDVTPVRRIQLRLADGGRLSIYPGHAPLLAETAGGAIAYTDGGGDAEIEVEAGILRITSKQVLVLVPGTLAHGEQAPGQTSDAREHRFERLAATLLEMLHEEPELAGEEAA